MTVFNFEGDWKIYNFQDLNEFASDVDIKMPESCLGAIDFLTISEMAAKVEDRDFVMIQNSQHIHIIEFAL